MADNNFPVVNIQEFTGIIKKQLLEGNYRPVIGIGKGGIGKTESIEELAKKEMGIGHVDIRLLLYGETDLKGIPYPDEKHVKTIWLQNNILPVAERDGERGLLVLDEFTSAPRSVRTAAYQLLNERKLGEYVLPPGWIIVCLGNGIADGGDFNGMEGNFLNRCSAYTVASDFSVWKEWALNNGINPLVLSYLTWNVKHFHTFDPDDEYNLFASPRSWEAVSNIMNCPNADINDRMTYLRVCGNVGTVIGSSFGAFCKLRVHATAPEDILSGRAGVFSGDHQVLLITVQSVLTQFIAEAKASVANIGDLTDQVVVRGANMLKWLLNLKGEGMLEVQIMAIKDISKNSTQVAHKLLFSPITDQVCPEFARFIKYNKGVLS